MINIIAINMYYKSNIDIVLIPTRVCMFTGLEMFIHVGCLNINCFIDNL